MIVPLSAQATKPIVYPESNGEPMCESTRQLRWIMALVGNLRALFAERADVFVGGNQFWYPVEGDPTTRLAPDAYVVFGRPKGERGSYRQWEEAGIPLTVVFEVMSPSNTVGEMIDKHLFYAEHGVEEFYIVDPELNHLDGFRRRGAEFLRVAPIDGFVSPRLGIKFDLSGPELVIRYPDGRPFLSFEELDAARRTAEKRAEAEQKRAEAEQKRAEAAEQRAAQLAEKLRQLGVDPGP